MAYEWIQEKIDLNVSAWVVLRPESGTIPQSARKFNIDWKARYGEQRRRPSRAILFVDDLPEFLPGFRGPCCRRRAAASRLVPCRPQLAGALLCGDDSKRADG